MPWLLNACYLILLVLLSPWLVYKAITTGRYRRGLREKLFGVSLPDGTSCSPVWFHGVSVGEIHLLRQVVAAFRKRHPQQAVLLSTTTDTGFEEARRCFPDLPVVYFPLDLSWAVRRTLRNVGPALIVLAESELWPNLLQAAKQAAVPVAVINARMSPRSFRRWRRFRLIARWLLARIDLLAAQTDAYAQNWIGLGAARQRVHVTGSVKYDGVNTDRHNSKTRDLAQMLGIGPDELVWIAGSTQAPEEELVLGIYQRLRCAHPNLHLLIVPRQKDRFDQVARLLERSGVPFLRRSSIHSAADKPPPAVILMDTIGELSALWGLADVAFVGGSLDGQRGGQNMIEPAAFGAGVVFGPHVWNFQDAATRLLNAGGARQVQNAAELEAVIGELIANAALREQLGRAGQAFVLAQQGATLRTLDLLDGLLADKAARGKAA